MLLSFSRRIKNSNSKLVSVALLIHTSDKGSIEPIRGNRQCVAPVILEYYPLMNSLNVLAKIQFIQ